MNKIKITSFIFLFFLLFPVSGITADNVFQELIIDKASWNIRVINNENESVFANGGPYSFYVEGRWVEVKDDKERAGNKLVIKGDTLLEMKVDDITFRLSVKKTSDYAYNIQINSPTHEIEKSSGVVTLNPVEEIYGFGEMWNGQVAQRGQSIKIWNRIGTPDECAYMPYYVSTNNYAFFLNYGGLVNFDVGKSRSDELIFDATSNGIDINIVLGESIASTVKNFFSIFGMPAKPPRWAFKPWFWLMADPFSPGDGGSSFYPYKIYVQPEGRLNTLKGEHFISTAKKFREMDIPVSVTWFEPPWQTARTSFIPNKSFSTDLKKLVEDLDQLGIKSLGWTVPYTTNESPNWSEGFNNGYLALKPDTVKVVAESVKVNIFGEAIGTSDNYIDFYNPEASEWWQKEIEKSLELGLKGFKLDDGQDLAKDSKLHGGRLGADYHNSYGLEYNKTFYSALKKKYDDDFLMIPRSAWIGSSSYTNFKWPGDLTGTFSNSGLPYSVSSMLSLSFCGFPFLTTDIGGFVDKPSPERVWIRWAQFGAFTPGMQTLHMPWWYSPEAQEHYRYLSWLHTELVPLWNTLSKESQLTAAPITKPLVWDFQDDINTWRVDNEFTVGEVFLVAPVTDVKEHKEYYLPEGRWYYFWDDNIVLEGKQTLTWLTYKEGLYKFPLYIKEGAIIPMQVENNYTGFGNKESKEFITIVIYPKKEGLSSFLLDDTGNKVNFEVKNMNEQLLVNWSNSDKDFLFRIHNDKSISPSKILNNDSELLPKFDGVGDFTKSARDGWFYDEKSNKTIVRIKNHMMQNILLTY